MSFLKAAAAGLFGASALTLVHETARRVIPDAPRMDVLGMRALAGMLRAVGQEPPPDDELHKITLAGDLASNALYYSAVALGSPEGALKRGTLLGLAAGVGAVVLPGPLGLGTEPSARTPATQVMSVAWYTLGGAVAGAVYRRMMHER